jgi:hypothetical protein
MQVAAAKRKRDRIPVRVAKGSVVPLDACAAGRLRERGYRIGDVLLADFTKPRNPKFNRLVHRIGQLVVANIDAFAGLDAHVAIKRIQIEGRISCDEIGICVPGFGMVIQFIPRSLSFQSMDEGEYHQAAKDICRTIAERYWPDMDPDAIAEMAESMVDE